MQKFVVGTVVVLLAAATGGRAEDEAPPPADAPVIDTLPWNPDIHHANDWPYDKAVVVPTDYCGPPGDFWLRAEYYLWHLQNDRLPALTAPLVGGDSPDTNPHSGGRFTAGVWFDEYYRCGFEGSYFFLADRAAPLATVSPTTNGQETTELQGAAGTLVWNGYRSCTWSYDLTAAFRYLDLGGVLHATDDTTTSTGRTTRVDEFAARNHFYGGELGGRAEYRWRCLVFDVREKLALGGHTTDVTIGSGTLRSDATGTLTRSLGGLLAQPGAIGRQSDSSFALVNEFGVQAGWQICDYVQAFVGYTVLYWSSVVRPGGLVNVSAPAVYAPRETDFWATGLNVGLEVRY